ncbi:MAG: hypothetical protein JEZ00_11505 [Anaerolineaceae bacterium]|nr:hypothetical protein [Anaerolineaceae bacterium]
MPKINTVGKPVRSFRLSQECSGQLQLMAHTMGRSESTIIEVALDRMFREELRFNRSIKERAGLEDQYRVDHGDSENENGIQNHR